MNGRNVVKTTIEYIEEHLAEELSLDKIAEALHYSKFYLEREFVRETGCTVYKYIQRRRLTLAARKLAETREQIGRIAYEAQYNSQQAFCLAFRRLYQCSPREYRRRGVYYPLQERIVTLALYSGVFCGKQGWEGRLAS